MTAKQTTVEDLRQAAVEQEQLRKVCRMKSKLRTMDTCVLDQASLDSLGVIIGHPLNVDDIKGLWDSRTRFFQPWVSIEHLTQVGAIRSSSWEDKLVPGEHKIPEWMIGDLKARWFKVCLEDLYEMDPELWEPWL